MGSFTLDTSTLLGGQFNTQPDTSLVGPFKDAQWHFSQSVASQDLELHYFEVHLTVGGVTQEPVA